MHSRITLALAFALALSACSQPAPRPQADEEQPQTYWPVPPDQPRFQYEVTLRRSGDLRDDKDKDSLRRALVGEDPNAMAFQKPGAVVAAKGRIYVADTQAGRVAVFDVPRRKVFSFGHRPEAELKKPAGLALDAAGNVYVADHGLRGVLVFDPLGLFIKRIGQAKDLDRPTGVAVNAAGDRIYIVDRSDNETDRHRVLIYDGGGNKLGEIGTRGAEPGQFNVPLAAAVGPDGVLHVLDSGNFRVQSFDPDGRFLRSIGQVGSTFGSLARPRAIAVDKEGNLYVGDASFGNFQMFDREGRLLLAVGRTGRKDLPGQFGLVSGVAVDETLRVYVADQAFNKLEVYRRLSDEEGRRILAAKK